MSYPTDDSAIPHATEATTPGSELRNGTALILAEDFHSYQGEGTFTGTPMHFIRTAGCSVGRSPITSGEVQHEVGKDRDFPILKTGRVAWRCYTYDGRGFWCDTDFQKGTVTPMREIITNTWEHHVCITGGEPLVLRDRIDRFIEMCYESEHILPHIETSGTIDWTPKHPCWITVSPKIDYLPCMLERADEIKLLIDPSFDLNKVPAQIQDYSNVFIQPINDENHIDVNNLRLCDAILRQRPNWHLSVQLHKCFGWR